MASGGRLQTGSTIRHRIQDITLDPITSGRPVELEIWADGRLIHALPMIESDHQLQWDMRLYPCDVHRTSRIVLRITKKLLVSPRTSTAEYAVLDAEGKTSLTIKTIERKGIFTVVLTFSDNKDVESAYSAALARSRVILEADRGPLERMGKARSVLEEVVSLSEAAAELYPTAKIVATLFVTAWEHIDAIQRNHRDMQRLVDGLNRMLPFLGSVRKRCREGQLQDAVIALLNLVEDTANFVTSYSLDTTAARILRNPVSGKAVEQLDLLLERFNDLKEDFDRGVQVEQFKRILTTEQRTLLNTLSPASRAHYSHTLPCQEGTREEALRDIYEWSTTSASKKLGWLFGQAGLGKSCISSSVCRGADEENRLGAHFFCKRDDPELRRPESLLNTIVHQLATRFEPYGHEVARAIAEDPQITESPLEQRYTRLLSQPLLKLRGDQVNAPSTLLVLIDAFDECERGRARRVLLTNLRELSGLVPWLKVMVTSRPEQDIKGVLGKAEDPLVWSRDILAYDASFDIYARVQQRMVEIAEFKAQVDWPEHTIRMLAERSCGLFIWIETACKFIENGSDVDSRLEQILDGTQPTEGSEPLDMLFTTAIEQSLGDGAQDNVRNAKLCIAAVIATADRTPMSVAGLEALMSSQVKRGVFRNVINGLGSVLYEDKDAGNSVRAYHPSFVDFMASGSRSKRFYMEPQEQNTRMAECCLRTMIRELRFNICGLESSHTRNQDVPDLASRVQNTISEHLRYSCLHWTSHVLQAPKGALKELLGEFIFGRTLLYWIEAMGLLAQLKTALSSLLELVEWCSGNMDNIGGYAHDVYRLVLAFYDAISESTPHLYVSALALCPTDSKVAQRMRPQFPKLLKLETSKKSEWAPWIRTIPHGATVAAVAFSNDGRRIVSGCGDSLIRVWDADTGTALCDPLVGHSGFIRTLAFSSDDRRILSSSFDLTAKIWDSETGNPILSFSHPSDLMCAIFSPDERRVVTGCYGGTFQIWDAETGAEVTKPLLEHSQSVDCLAYTPDGKRIVSGSQDYTIRFWDSDTGAVVGEPLTQHTDFVYSLAFSKDGRHMLSGSNDKTICIWDAETYQVLFKLSDGDYGPVWSASYSPSGRHIISGTWDRGIRLWDAETGALLSAPLMGHSGAVRAAVFSPNGRRIVSGSEDGTVRVWDTEVSQVAPVKPLRVLCVAISPDSQKVASAHMDGIVRVWEVKTGAVIYEQAFDRPGQTWSTWAVAFSRDGPLIAASCGGNIWVWNAETGVAVSDPLVGHEDLILALAFSPDSRLLASGSDDKSVRVWDVAQGGAAIEPLLGHTKAVRCVAFTSDNLRLVSTSNDATIRIWDAKSGALIRELNGHLRPVCALAITPDDKTIITGAEDNTMLIWDAETGVAVTEPLMGDCGVVFSVSLSPDGTKLAVAPYDNTVQVWDVEKRQIAARPLNGHLDYVKNIAWSPDGTFIASGSHDGTVRIWDADIDKLKTRSDILRSELPKLPNSASQLAFLVDEHGWVSTPQGELLVWVPVEYRRKDDSTSQLSPLEVEGNWGLDSSRFVHGESWTQVAGN